MSEFTTDDLKAINAAIASGALLVEYNDRRVTYRSMKDLLQARQIIKKDLGLVNRSSRVLCKTKKGTV